MSQRLRPLATTAAVAALVLLTALGPVAAQQPSPSAPAGPQAAPRHMHAHGRREPVEARIEELHGKLQITPAQEAQWTTVAQTMRDNQKSAVDIIRDKRQNEATMSAVDDLRAYADIAENHATGVRKLADAFATLYAGMSDQQKKIADEVFRQHKRRSMHRH